VGTITIVDQALYRNTVTRLSREVPLAERECFAFFAVQLAKLHKRCGVERIEEILSSKFDIFQPLVTAHESLLNMTYSSCGTTTQKNMRVLVEMLRKGTVKY